MAYHWLLENTHMKITQLKGLILEEAVAKLLADSGYRLITEKRYDPESLDVGPNGLRVRGRGGQHQADALGELVITPIFSDRLRLFVEAKWKQKTKAKIGINVVRNAIAVLTDVNQWLRSEGKRGRARALPQYKSAIFSITGYTADALDMAAAYNIFLVDLSIAAFAGLRAAVDKLGDVIVAKAPKIKRNGRASTTDTTLKGDLVRALIRNSRLVLVRSEQDAQQELEDKYEDLEQQLGSEFREFDQALNGDSKLYFASTSTGHLVVMKARDRRKFGDALESERPLKARITYNPQDTGGAWTMRLSGEDNSPGVTAVLDFSLPKEILATIQDQEGDEQRRRLALGEKQRHFGSFWIIGTDRSGEVVQRKISIDQEWWQQAVHALRR